MSLLRTEKQHTSLDTPIFLIIALLNCREERHRAIQMFDRQECKQQQLTLIEECVEKWQIQWQAILRDLQPQDQRDQQQHRHQHHLLTGDVSAFSASNPREKEREIKYFSACLIGSIGQNLLTPNKNVFDWLQERNWKPEKLNKKLWKTLKWQWNLFEKSYFKKKSNLNKSLFYARKFNELWDNL